VQGYHAASSAVGSNDQAIMLPDLRDRHFGALQPSPSDQWYTDEQVDYLQALVANDAIRMVEAELGPTVDRINRSNGVLQIKPEVPHANPPAPLVDEDDMVGVEPPCHPEKPLKIVGDWDDIIHCLVCDTPFRV
jgi:hypothetical protein